MENPPQQQPPPLPPSPPEKPTGKPKMKSRRCTRSGNRTQEGNEAFGWIDLIGEDLLLNVLARLPASSFASAACVSRSWNSVSDRVLSRPKLSSAFSLNPSPQGSVKEVIDKVLSEPLRPHFAIACISPTFSLGLVHRLITEKLGMSTPLVTYQSRGIIGRNAVTGVFKEVQWDVTVQDESQDLPPVIDSGIMLTVGFLPGLKVDTVPLRAEEDSGEPLAEKFVMDIREYASSKSDRLSPAAIIMFGGPSTDMKPVLDKLDFAFHSGTIIVGDESGNFLYRGQDTRSRTQRSAGVSLVFVRDRNRPAGIGEVEFHMALSTGMSPVGPMFKAVSVKERLGENSIWLTARRGEQREILDGQTLLDDTTDEIGDDIECPVLYIGVSKRRKCSLGTENVKWMTSLAFYEVTGGDQEYLFLYGSGMKTGDPFRFYFSDSSIAESSSSIISGKLKKLKEDWSHVRVSANTNGPKKEAFGGIMFCCCGRGESFFNRPIVDSTPFLENFPGVPLSGTFCSGEIGRGSSSMYHEDSQEQSSMSCCLHAYSCIYLVMSYTPPAVQEP